MFSTDWNKTDCSRKKRWYAIYHKPRFSLNITDRSMLPIICFAILIFLTGIESVNSPSVPIVIGHRGASGYLPEHTLPSKALAYGQGADYLEQDVVLSKDDIPIVIHDIYLDEVSDVASIFPMRNRSDGRFYVIDFTAKEIKTLRASERFSRVTGKPVFSNRFPLDESIFSLHTLAEELEFIAGLNKANIDNKRQVGAYVEIKDPSFHQNHNRSNISEIVLDVLANYNYTKRTDKIFLQCFDIEELQRIRLQLKSDLKLVGLLTDNKYRSELSKTDYPYWTSEIGIEDLSTFTDGIAPHYTQLFEQGSTLEPSILFNSARKYNLLIHPYTFRSDTDSHPFASFNIMLEFFIDRLKIDGLFIDQPDKAVAYLRSKQQIVNQGTKLGNLSVFLIILLFVMTRL